MIGFLLGFGAGVLLGSMTSGGWGRWAWQAGARALALEMIRGGFVGADAAARMVQEIGERGRRLP